MYPETGNMEKKVIGKGIRLNKGESALDAMKKRVPHWIHDTKKDEHYINGVIYLPGCTCSECGFHSSREKDVCPHCGKSMHSLKGIY